MLRILVGVAAVAVVGYVGYFFFGEYSRYQGEVRLEAFRQERSRCLELLDRYAKQDYSLRAEVETCASSFYITADDVNAARRP